MSAIAKTVAEAQAGEMVWHYDPDANRYDEARKYQGRGVWKLTTVLEVGRLSIIAGDPAYPRGAQKYDRKTGAMRVRSGYSGTPYLRGYQERAANWWQGHRQFLADKVRNCTDEEALRSVAFTLGLEGPPDFSVAPTPSASPIGRTGA